MAKKKIRYGAPAGQAKDPYAQRGKWPYEGAMHSGATIGPDGKPIGAARMKPKKARKKK